MHSIKSKNHFFHACSQFARKLQCPFQTFAGNVIQYKRYHKKTPKKPALQNDVVDEVHVLRETQKILRLERRIRMPVIRPAWEPKKVVPLLQRNGLQNLEAQLGEFGAPESGWGFWVGADVP